MAKEFEQINFFEMMEKENSEKKEPAKKEMKKAENEPLQDETEKVEEEPVKVEKTPVSKEKNKKTSEKKKNEKKKKVEPTQNTGTFSYPFSLYTEGRTVDISNYGFEEGKNYTEAEISSIMLQHRHYEFAGEITYKMFEEDNMLVATAKQYKKG